MEAKTELNFECYDAPTDTTESLNGLTRNETDKIIRKHFGTLEDFLMTSMSSQLGALQFISEGSTRRKEILASNGNLDLSSSIIFILVDNIEVFAFIFACRVK